MDLKGPVRGNLVPFLVFAAFIAAAWFFGPRIPVDEAALKAPLAALPLPVSCVLFLLLYIAVTFFLWFSKDVFRLAAALVFGAELSTLLVWLGEMGNCCVLFFFARRMGKEYIESSIPPKMRSIYGKAGEAGFGWLLLLRCAPVFPFRFLDLGAGLSPVRFKRYFAASLIGTPLRVYWMQVVLAAAGTTAFKGPQALAGYLESRPGLVVFSVSYIAAMTIALIALKRRERACR